MTCACWRSRYRRTARLAGTGAECRMNQWRELVQHTGTSSGKLKHLGWCRSIHQIQAQLAVIGAFRVHGLVACPSCVFVAQERAGSTQVQAAAPRPSVATSPAGIISTAAGACCRRQFTGENGSGPTTPASTPRNVSNWEPRPVY